LNERIKPIMALEAKNKASIKPNDNKPILLPSIKESMKLMMLVLYPFAGTISVTSACN